MRHIRPITEDEIVRWNAEALTVVQENQTASRRSLLFVPPQVFVDARWRTATMVLEGEWEFRMHIVDYTTPMGGSMPCAVIDALDMQPFLEWCLLELDLEKRADVTRMRVVVESHSGKTLNVDPAYQGD